jgi:hypothetical protein
MTVAESARSAADAGRRELNVSLSLRTILLVAGLAAVAWALASIANVLLVIFVSLLASVVAFGALFGLIGAIIGVPIAAGLQIVADELTAGRRARIAAEDTATKELA